MLLIIKDLIGVLDKLGRGEATHELAHVNNSTASFGYVKTVVYKLKRFAMSCFTPVIVDNSSEEDSDVSFSK